MVTLPDEKNFEDIVRRSLKETKIHHNYVNYTIFDIVEMALGTGNTSKKLENNIIKSVAKTLYEKLEQEEVSDEED